LSNALILPQRAKNGQCFGRVFQGIAQGRPVEIKQFSVLLSSTIGLLHDLCKRKAHLVLWVAERNLPGLHGAQALIDRFKQVVEDLAFVLVHFVGRETVAMNNLHLLSIKALLKLAWAVSMGALHTFKTV
jgi:hypothetical protein